jgi:hypothetical protein
MYALKHWHRWLMAIFGLPIIVMLSTFIISQSQVGQLVPADMPFQSTLWAALQLSLTSGMVWLIWRQPAPKRNWSIIGSAIIEGSVLCGISLTLLGWLEIIDITWQITTESIVAMIGLALPLAWWSIAEERVLRGELQTLLSNFPPFLRTFIMLGIAWLVQMSLVSTYSLFVALVLVFTEGLSILTWSGHAGFERAWTRRWVWRWLFIAGAGISVTGFITATPAPLRVFIDDPFISMVLVATPLVTWTMMTIVQHVMAKWSR